MRCTQQRSNRRQRAWQIFLRALVFTSCLGAIPLQQGRAQSPTEGGVATQPVGLRPGDKVKLWVWREPDLSGEFLVDEGGGVIFPKIGTVSVNEISSDSLRNLLVAKFALSLRDPAIEVTMLRRINVAGAVRNPGFYYVDPTVSVEGAVALAGGVSGDGNQSKLELIRGGSSVAMKISRSSAVAATPMQSGDYVRVPQRSWFSRNVAIVSGIATIVVAALLRS